MAVMDLQAIRGYLRIDRDDSDVALQACLDAAVATIGQRVGPLEPASFTARVYVSGHAIVLPVAPLVSVTSIGPVGGDALSVGDLSLDLEAAIIGRTDGYAFDAGHYDVAYVAGWSTVPADLMLAVKEQVRHLFSASQRGAGQTRPGTPADGSGSRLMPPIVQSLIEPYRTPGVR